jgi:hypothetical protein
LENIGKSYLIVTLPVKAKAGLIMITRPALRILVWNKGILHKAQSIWQKDPWTITTVHTNRTITIQCGNKEERLNIRRVELFEE